MVLYGITFVSFADDFCADDPVLLTPLYIDDVEFDGLAQVNAKLLNLLM